MIFLKSFFHFPEFLFLYLLSRGAVLRKLPILAKNDNLWAGSSNGRDKIKLEGFYSIYIFVFIY